MSITKLNSIEIQTVLKLKGVHKTIAYLCDTLGFSFKLLNDVLHELPKTRNTKFKNKMYSSLPVPITEYLNRVVNEYRTEVDLTVLTRDNSPLWVSQVVSETSHFISCLSFGLRQSIDPTVRERLSWVQTDADVLKVYNALYQDDVVSLDGFTEAEFKAFKVESYYKSGCNSSYLHAELSAFSNDDVRYIVLGKPYDFRNPESTGYTGRVRLIRYGDCWSMDTIYGNLGVSRTKLMNWLTNNGYTLVTHELNSIVDREVPNKPNNTSIYFDDSFYPRGIYQCKPLDYTGTLKYNSLLFNGERVVTELTKTRIKTKREYQYYYGSTVLEKNSDCVHRLYVLHMLNEILPGSVVFDATSRQVTLNRNVGDYRIKAIGNSRVSIIKHNKQRIDINFLCWYVEYDNNDNVWNFVDYYRLKDSFRHPYKRARVLARCVKQLIHSI